jgi:hypothetical protein
VRSALPQNDGESAPQAWHRDVVTFHGVERFDARCAHDSCRPSCSYPWLICAMSCDRDALAARSPAQPPINMSAATLMRSPAPADGVCRFAWIREVYVPVNPA